jgi:hypothetical protein
MKHLGRTLISANDVSGKKKLTIHGTEDIKAKQQRTVPQSDFRN